MATNKFEKLADDKLNVNRKTANWRIYGGGGMVLGGLVWTIGELLAIIFKDGGFDHFVSAIGLIIVGLGVAIVAFGQTGSNGAVGNDVVGKVALYAAALGFVLFGVVVELFDPAPKFLIWIIGILLVAGTAVAAVRIQQKGVARGIALYAMYAIAAVSLLLILGATGLVPALFTPGFRLVLALLVVVAGILYVLNRKDIDVKK